jgi:hypothetical protein
MTIQVRDATERGRYIISSHRIFDQGRNSLTRCLPSVDSLGIMSQLRIASVPPTIRAPNVGREREEMFSAHEPIRKGPCRF